MEKLLTPWELTPLFIEGNHFAGGELEASLLLLSKSKVTGWLSIFNIYWKRATPGTGKVWIFWSFIAIAGAVATAILSPGSGIVIGVFLGFLMNALTTVAKCVELTEAKYNHSVDSCLRLLSTVTKTTWSEIELREIVSAHAVKNLAEFKAVVQQHPKLVAATAPGI